MCVARTRRSENQKTSRLGSGASRPSSGRRGRRATRVRRSARVVGGRGDENVAVMWCACGRVVNSHESHAAIARSHQHIHTHPAGGDPALTFDYYTHTDALRFAERGAKFKNMLNQLALEAVSQRTGLPAPCWLQGAAHPAAAQRVVAVHRPWGRPLA